MPNNSTVLFCCCTSSAACATRASSSDCICGGDPAQTSEGFLRFLTPLAVVLGVFLLHVLWQRIVIRLPAYERAHKKVHSLDAAMLVLPSFVPVDEPVELPPWLAALYARGMHDAIVSTDAIDVTLPPLRCSSAPTLTTK